MSRMRAVAMAATTAIANFVQQHSKKMAVITLVIITIFAVIWMMIQMSIMDSQFKLWILTEIVPWRLIAWIAKVMVWSGKNPITAIALQIILVIMAGTFAIWAYRRRNPKVTPTPTPSPAKTTAASPAKTVTWKKRVGNIVTWVLVIAVVGFLGKAGYDNYTRPGHGVIGAIADFIESGRTARTHPKKVVVTGETSIITAPPAPEWSEAILTPGPFSVNPDEGAVISVRKSNGTIVKGITRDLGKELGNTFTLEFQSEGKTPALVAVVK